MIQIRSLTKTFKGQTVLNDLSLDVPEGRITVVIGPSGTGKSVLLKHILGLIKPDSGSILIDGHDITAMNELQLKEVRSQFGVCFQDAALFDSMNVGENVGFPFAMHTDYPPGGSDGRWTGSHRVGLSGIETKMPSQISGACAGGARTGPGHEAGFILFDEPPPAWTR